MKKIISLLLVLLTIIPLSSSAASPQIEIPFDDIVFDSWYYSAVKYDYLNGVVSGVAKGKYDPSGIVTREMIVTVLSAIDEVNRNIYNYQSEFKDVKTGAWYAASVNWAKERGITGGMGNNTFGIGLPATREHVVTFLYTYLNKKGYGDKKADLNKYIDSSLISSWAYTPFSSMVQMNIVSGNSAYTLNPKGNCTRAELAVMLYRVHYLVKYGKDIPDTKDADSVTIKQNSDKRILCWGDSLTQGMGASSDAKTYPGVIERLTGIETINFGIGGEPSELIAMRQGGIPVYAEPMTIPATCTPIAIDIVDDYGEPTDMGYFGMNGINTLRIAGVEGTLKKTGAGYSFTRSVPGRSVRITKPTRIVTYGMTQRGDNDILVLYIGSNNWYRADEAKYLFEIQRKMIAYSETDKYVVVGFTAKPHMSEIEELNKALAEEYKERFIDVRQYMLTDALSDYGIIPTYTDIVNIRSGEIPASLRSDPVHGNDIFYDIIGKMVTEKIKDLGYLD